MEQNKLDLWASVLNEARVAAKPIRQISQQVEISRADAYTMQETQLKTRSSQGEKQIGWKMGLTSEAKRRQMNLDSPLYGFLTDRMEVKPGQKFSLKNRIHSKIEPEVAFLIGQDLKAPVTREQALKACSAVCSALEILDSRYEQFKYFSMEDVIADNSSSSDFALGPWRKNLTDLDLKELKMQMKVNGETAQTGISKDISGDPILSVVQLCELLAERGQTLKAGSIVLAGAATAAVELKPGMKIELSVDGLEDVTVNVETSVETP